MSRKRNPDDKSILSFWNKAAFGIGGFSDSLMQNSINSIGHQVFNIFLGVNPVLVGLAISIARIWDAFTDPTMGMISDNTRTRFGRRRPYMLVGGFLASVSFILLWRVPVGWSETGHFLWFLFGSIIFYTFYTIYTVPFNALSYELSPYYHERTRLMAFRCFFASFAGLSIGWMFRLTQMDCFENTLDGMRTVSVVAAIIMFATVTITTVFSKVRLAHSVSKQEKISLIKSLKVTLGNKVFLRLVATIILACLGLYMVGQLGIYINIYYVFSGNEKAAATIMGFGGMVYNLTGAITAAPLISYLSSRFGKKRILMGGLVLAMVGSMLKFVTYNPHWPYLQMVSLVLMSPGLACLWILVPSMVADICDEDELATGVRREGMYGAVYTNVMKLGVSIGLVIVGIILNATGFRAELGADQLPHTLLAMRICYAVIPATGLLLALLCISRYPITAETARAVRLKLEGVRKPKQHEICHQKVF